MSVVNPAMMSSEERPVGLRTRSDLIISESVYQGEVCWIVKDPLAMKYFRLRKPEYLILQSLYRPTSYHALKSLLSRKFPEVTTRLESVQQLVVSLHQNSLLISNSPGQSLPLQKRLNKEVRQKAIGLLSSIVSLRFPGFDPERLLNWMYPKCRWMFSRVATIFVLVICTAALLLVLTNFELFMSKLPDFQKFFAFDNILFMGFLLIFTKTIHEFGHGLMCKHYGGECHEIGFMLLVLMPAMYCNTSDSWILPSRWKRIAIGAAGMYVELFIAAIATFVWWYTHPGWIHYLALNIMFLSSVSTIVFNANPLLRYDGYYMLSDYLEIPNLGQKSRMSLVSKLRVLCLGMKPVNARQLPERHQFAFAVYSVLSFVYRWFVMIMIFWFIAEIFEPYGLAAIGHMVIAISLIGMVVMPFYKMVKFFLYPGRLREVKKPRFYATLVLSAAAIWFICYFPMPHYVWANFVVRPSDSQMLVLNQPGILTEAQVSEGQRVQKGDILAVIENDQLTLDLQDIEGQLARLKSDLSDFQIKSSSNLDLTDKITSTQLQIKSIEKLIRLKSHQLDQLIVRAERAGQLFAPANLPRRAGSELELATWSGTPLDGRNIGTYFNANTELGSIGEPDKMEAILVVNQSDVKLLAPGQRVIALTQQYKNTFVETSISFVSQDELVDVPRELSQTNGGPIAVKPDPSGKESPILKSFEARALFDAKELEAKNIQLLPGMRGDAKIHVGSSSLGNRLMRYLSTVINFR